MSTPGSKALEWPSKKVRQTFVDYFVKENGHTFVPSSPSVPVSDPTLLFANSGMNQFKTIFIGQADPNSELGKLKCAANSQKCIRAGGKHNDLDDVGKDTYHHTFFEMLGNWSFGDYFKEGAITMAWKLLTEVYKLPKENMYVTYFEGSEELGVPADLEARDLWRRYMPDDHILPGDMKDNFWEMGETGPCGPCSEVHYDRLGGRNAADRVNKDDPMVIEIWNLVFMQFNRQADRSLQSLPSKHVDTGMGFERITSILQNVHSNYDTDIWTRLFDRIQEVTGCPQSYHYQGADKNEDIVVAYRVVADHIRTITFALVDGAAPDNVGRGYVLRRIVRRAIRFAHEFLGAKVGFFVQLVDAVVEELGEFFPELLVEKNILRTKALIKEEEDAFAKTWSSGLKQFQEMAKNAKGGVMSGKDAFILHDRYGFPVDLTMLMAEKTKLQVDTAGFNIAMEQHQKAAGEKAKAAGTFLDAYAIDDLRKREVPTTLDAPKYEWDKACTGKILGLFDPKAAAWVESCSSNDVGIVLDTTCFYAESGGQIYDTGAIKSGDGAVANVNKVYNYAGYVCHISSVASGEFKVGSEVSLNVDYDRRRLAGANHTMTHMLNHSLRKVLEYARPDSFNEVNQKGSFVSDELLRFDFSFNAKLEAADLKAVEDDLKESIANDLKVYSKDLPLETAMSIKSLRCMFDDKYGDTVKLVTVGISVDEVLQNPSDEAKLRQYSIELCGGTHIPSLKQAGDLAIVGEDALTKGVRRMTVVTGPAASKAIAEGVALESKLAALTSTDCGAEHDDRLKALSVLLKDVNESNAPLLMKIKLRDAIENAVKATNASKKEYGAIMLKKSSEYATKFAEGLPTDAKFAVIAPTAEVLPTRDGLQAAVEIVSKSKNVPVIAFGVDTKKNTGMALAVSNVAGLNAVEWVKASTGKGGGKPNAAQGGFAGNMAEAAVQKATDYAKGLSL
eukprot:PhM_4_TR9/c0_g1_i1/m.90251/K01872/AARS, alaS; alanyl-tRNA synthetase